MARAEPLVADAADESTESAEEEQQPDRPEPRLNVCILGAPGAGKTYLCGTAEDDPRTSPVLYLDAENSGMTIDWRVQRLWPLQITNENCWKRLNGVLNAVEAGTAIYKPTGERYRTVVIDTLTAVADKILWSVVNLRPSKTRAIPGEAEGDDWSVYNNMLHRLVSGFRDAGVHVIMTAQEREYKAGVGPAMKGAQAPQQAMAAFNTIARLRVEREAAPGGKGVVNYRELTFQSDGKYLLKDRSDRLGTLPWTMRDPTIAALLDRIIHGREVAIARAAKLAQNNHQPQPTN